MGIVKETPLTPTACPKCEHIVLGGYVGGRRVLLDRWTIPLADADVLEKYRPNIVFAISIGQTAIWASTYMPGIHSVAGIMHACGDRIKRHGV